MSVNEEVLSVPLDKELKESYLAYAMSVIVNRAIPDVRDGLKPVHRRVLYAMFRGGYDAGKPYRKAARIVGDVIAKYHPHADTAIYDSLVRMAQDFSLLERLVDGQGNYGSIDGDPAASMRYTEARLTEIAHYLLNDLDEDTVGFRPNYDGNEIEPVVLPAEFPNLLVNGAGGVAVGMSTNIPSHNLGEVIDGCLMYIDNHDVTLEELMTVIHGPDFPTGGVIMGRAGILEAFSTGKGTITVQGKTHFEESSTGKTLIVIDELPYQVNKAKLIERIHSLAKEKRIEGISDLRDESSRVGIRVVIEAKRGVSVEVLLNQIMGLTSLRNSFSIHMLVLNEGRPVVMPIKDIIATFVHFRFEVLTRRTLFRLGKAREKAHILVGLLVAVLNIDSVIALIRSSKDPAEACRKLLEVRWRVNDECADLINLISDSSCLVVDGFYSFTRPQAEAILDLKLQRLTSLEQEKLVNELNVLRTMIKEFIALLSSKEAMMKLIKNGLLEVRGRFACARKTAIESDQHDYLEEDLIAKEDMVITVTMNGYIKSAKLSNYRTQKRGGKGRIGQVVREEDVVINIFVVNTHTNVLFFSNIGRVYKLKAYKLPAGDPSAKGRALVNVFPLADGEVINNVMPLPEDDQEYEIVFATAMGNVRRNALSDFYHVPSNGKIAMVLAKGDSIVAVSVCKADEDIFFATRLGKSVRFSVDHVRRFKGRVSDGVRAVRLSSLDDRVISMSVLRYTDFSQEQRDNYLKVALSVRLEVASITDGVVSKDIENAVSKIGMDMATFLDMASKEEFILTITSKGFGKRSSAYEHRTTGRGGSGVVNIQTGNRNGNVVMSFPVINTDHLVLITDKGKLIRIGVQDIRVTGRGTQGVTLFKTEPDERVVSVAKVVESGEDDGCEV